MVSSTDQPLSNLLFSAPCVGALTQILWQSNASTTVQQQITLAASLITKSCQEEWHREALADSGALDALAMRLASFVVSMGLVLPGAEAQRHTSEVLDSIPAPAPASAKLAPILEAIGSIIQFSKYRASQLLHSPAILTVFPRSPLDTSPAHDRRGPWGSFASSQTFTQQVPMNPIDYLLPQTPIPHHRGSSAQSSNFPPLGASLALGTHARTANALGWSLDPRPTDTNALDEEDESALVSWLMYITRTESGTTCLMAVWVLTILYRSGLTNKRRETALALLLIPLLVRMLNKDFKSDGDTVTRVGGVVTVQSSNWTIKEQAPAILAMLVMDSVELQKAAVDADAIKKLSQLLKESYDPLPKLSQSSMWDPDGADSLHLQGRESSNTSRLGLLGLSPLASHVVKMREGVLMALAAIAPFKDEYRKTIIDNGVVPFIIESLKPCDASPSLPTKGAESSSSPCGNPVAVLLAACGAARALSRSVSILRTSLIDAGVAAPLFALLKHQDMEVQIAATAVVCNLVLEFSPIREVSFVGHDLTIPLGKKLTFLFAQAIIDAGVLKVLCEHAHSLNAKLRLNSLWALKHLVYMTPNDVKMACLDQLGPGWLKQIVCNDTEDSALVTGSRGDESMGTATPIAMSTPNAAGEQVDLLNAMEESRETTPPDEEENEDGDLKMADSIGALSRPHPDFDSAKKGINLARSGSNRTIVSEATRARHAGMTEADANPAKQARTDNTAVQEQGLDFMRNLICGPGAAEMIDYLFRELGQDKVFEILAGKLRPRVINAYKRDKRLSSTPENGIMHIPPQTEIIVSVCHVISHIAAGSPRHRQLLISQTDLLGLLVPLFNHSHRSVRSCCAWVVINLTWVDDQSDYLNCKTRAMELRKLGVYEKLEGLEQDPELDVRERTKTAIHQMSTLLR